MAKKKALSPVRKPRRGSGPPIDTVAKESRSARAAKPAAEAVKSPRHVPNVKRARRRGMKPRPRASHIWPEQESGCYVDPPWCSAALFAAEPFDGRVHDPCAGTGSIVASARAAGFIATGSDLVPRDGSRPVDFLRSRRVHDNIIMNPPYARGLPEAFARHALMLARGKVAFCSRPRDSMPPIGSTTCQSSGCGCSLRGRVCRPSSTSKPAASRKAGAWISAGSCCKPGTTVHGKLTGCYAIKINPRHRVCEWQHTRGSNTMTDDWNKDVEGFKIITLKYARCDGDGHVISEIRAGLLLNYEISNDDLRCLLKLFNKVYLGYGHLKLFLTLGDILISRDPSFKSEFEASDTFKMAKEDELNSADHYIQLNRLIEINRILTKGRERP
jgi:hypothetical protein